MSLSVLLSSPFLCYHMFPRYFKLEPSWLRHEVTWVASSTLIFHICMHVATIVDLITLFGIVLSSPF
jgi:hypothetical protein